MRRLARKQSASNEITSLSDRNSDRNGYGDGPAASTTEVRSLFFLCYFKQNNDENKRKKPEKF